MTSLALTRPHILLLIGVPGSGKSFFARQFAAMFDAPLVSYDYLRYELFETPQFSSPENELIQRLAEYQTKELLKTKRTIIIDGGYNQRQERQNLELLAKKSGYSVLLIWVQTDPPTAQHRATHAVKATADNPYPIKLSDTQFQAQSQEFSPPQKEAHVVVSGKHAFRTQAKMVLRRLSGPRAEQASVTHAEAEPRVTNASGRQRHNVLIS